MPNGARHFPVWPGPRWIVQVPGIRAGLGSRFERLPAYLPRVAGATRIRSPDHPLPLHQAITLDHVHRDDLDAEALGDGLQGDPRIR